MIHSRISSLGIHSNDGMLGLLRKNLVEDHTRRNGHRIGIYILYTPLEIITPGI